MSRRHCQCCRTWTLDHQALVADGGIGSLLPLLIVRPLDITESNLTWNGEVVGQDKLGAFALPRTRFQVVQTTGYLTTPPLGCRKRQPTIIDIFECHTTYHRTIHFLKRLLSSSSMSERKQSWLLLYPCNCRLHKQCCRRGG